jgi:hypothetical protein
LTEALAKTSTKSSEKPTGTKHSTWQQWFVIRVLDVTHHWWMGALLMMYIVTPEIFWFGAGLFVDDLPDVPRRLKFFPEKMLTS